MKTISTLFFAGMLMSALCVAFVACNEPKETEQKDPLEGVGMAPAPESEVPKEVTAFFEEYVSIICASIFGYEDERGVHKSLADGCVIINSADELPEIDFDGTPVRYPDIDFNAYTLVVGSYVIGNGATYLASQSIIINHDIATINLILDYKRDVEGNASVELQSFFGLYPKNTAKSINMNITQPSW